MANAFHKILVFHQNGVALVQQADLLIGLNDTSVSFLDTERLLLDRFIKEIRGLDPDILTGFEMQKSSLGYLVERAFVLDLHLLKYINISTIHLRRRCAVRSRGCHLSELLVDPIEPIPMESATVLV